MDCHRISPNIFGIYHFKSLIQRYNLARSSGKRISSQLFWKKVGVLSARFVKQYDLLRREPVYIFMANNMGIYGEQHYDLACKNHNINTMPFPIPNPKENSFVWLGYFCLCVKTGKILPINNKRIDPPIQNTTLSASLCFCCGFKFPGERFDKILEIEKTNNLNTALVDIKDHKLKTHETISIGDKFFVHVKPLNK